MKKITIVIGAGASADFKINQDSSQYLEEKVKMPTGEELSKLIADKSKIIDFFCFQFLKKVANISLSPDFKLELLDKSINATYEYFTPISPFGHELSLKNNDNFVRSLDEALSKIVKKQNERYSDTLLRVVVNYAVSIVHHLFKEALKRQAPAGNHDARKYLHSEIINSDEFKIYFELSALVEYYQPFSIDELLDSIKNGKVDVQPTFNASDPGKISDPVKLQEYRNDLVTVGKQLIALFLLQAEDDKIFIDKKAICWYRHLRNLIITSGKDSKEIKESLENLTIISFNYDRSLDYFLCSKIGQEFYDKIKIIYPYGKLAQNYNDISYGYYKKSVKSAQDKYDFFEKVKILGSSLRVVGELSDYSGENLLRSNEEDTRKYRDRMNQLKKNLTNDSDKKIIEDLLLICDVMNGGDENKKFYFLGFGFHEENCRIINLKGIKVGIELRHQIHYTNFNNSKKIEEILSNALSDPAYHLKNYRFKFPSEKGVYYALLEDLNLSF
jgi:hypothetical protein